MKFQKHGQLTMELIYYKPNTNKEVPQQIIANTSQTGAYDMLNLQLKLLEDISGVQGALQGQAPKAGTPAFFVPATNTELIYNLD